MNNQNYNNLTPEEERIIIHKGTEAPYSGEYNNFSKRGIFHCKQCNNALYNSDDKFSSGCGWPSFDDAIPGAIRRQIDGDGTRVEMLCANCDGHLGHIFEGEQLTKKNIRHCVNSISLSFTPTDVAPENGAKAYFAAGCFWGVEHLFDHHVGVISAVSGYMGGHKSEPIYQEVIQGNTGHLEAVAVTYDPQKVDYKTLAKFFFEIHDPTQPNGQGPDIGSQYLSAVFYENDAEKTIINELITVLKSKGYDVVTKVISAETFWEAEDYHQDYYDKKHQQPYCHIHQKKF
jgi:peptide methionine sulfoxide reductase msrA/msrB